MLELHVLRNVLQGTILLNFVILNYRVIFEFVALISGSVLYFSGSYIPIDKRLRKFIFIVFVFVLRIFFIVFSLNLVRIMLGWDGLGIISYILCWDAYCNKESCGGCCVTIKNCMLYGNKEMKLFSLKYSFRLNNKCVSDSSGNN
ncbi:NADH-ubiquinone oxidoreductase chain 5 [Armadillidium nasatum]|uniref:NADH-ubiquinone oxidoreductase chain 5 n=1 Tax=Armadillidium nasatum TaxID=96803 RepID=A0A5N5T883_9CRUS|nr:NADH-ubiquinone oxidoreductase chain 5 [Armadillidium nasatum]KAB7502258.1 hypothetical protein Anas_14699 [Armadillidium nasatum]KAB7502259.1 NADH-ubiquinone oxidoreductase chain 5 [Armadillidium nasatum]